MAAINDPFARFGARARTKFILLGSSDFLPENFLNWVRSLNLEHVSPATLRLEISRRAGSAAADEAAVIASVRKWFFTRKPDAGFVLTDFPATLLQAQVFDEWLDARDESLNGILAGPGSFESVVQHYRTLGLFIEASDLAA
jgi:adenylate kinase